MSIRADALAYIDSLAAGPHGKSLGAGRGGVPSTTVFTSKLYSPAESWTGRRSWWHQVPLDRVQGGGVIVLVCEHGVPAFDVLAVPAEWFRQHHAGLHQRDGTYDLFLSAEPDELFVDRRGKGGLSLSTFRVPPDSPGRISP